MNDPAPEHLQKNPNPERYCDYTWQPGYIRANPTLNEWGCHNWMPVDSERWGIVVVCTRCRRLSSVRSNGGRPF